MSGDAVRNRLAVVTGASSGIGKELAKLAAQHGNDVIVAADEPAIHNVRDELQSETVTVESIECDLGTAHGVDELIAKIGSRPVGLLMANAGIGIGGKFLDQPFDAHKSVIDVNVTGTAALVHAVGSKMRYAGEGRILITGSIVDDIPGPYNIVYNASKAFIDNFGFALRDELKDSGVTVTCLMPGLTDTAFFERAGMEDTGVGRTDLKDDPADVAQDGYRAMMAGEAGVVGGNFMNKVQSVFSELLPEPLLAAMHRQIAKPR
ncbi:MAG: SDR family NAD(P)-dependent oxidoreductase [Parerythrobacter sp.]